MSDFENFKVDWADVYEKLDVAYHGIVDSEFGNSDVAELLRSTSSNNILFWPDGTENFKYQLPEKASKYDEFFLKSSIELTSVLRGILMSDYDFSEKESMEFIIPSLPMPNKKANATSCDEFAQCENERGRVSAPNCCKLLA